MVAEKVYEMGERRAAKKDDGWDAAKAGYSAVLTVMLWAGGLVCLWAVVMGN